MKNFKVKDLVITSLFIALVYVFTWIVKIQLPFAPNGGLIHLGNVPFFLAAIFFDKRVGMTAGAIGMGLFDLTSGLGTVGTNDYHFCVNNGIHIE